MKPSFQSLFEKHLMLIYSGTVRLAKNLLQNVIHNWYIHEKKIIDCFNELRINADLCYEAFLNEDLESIGTLLSRYWQQKKILAPNSEPKHVSQFLIAVDPYIYGGSLCGAGGGGFMCLIIKDVSFRDQINLLVSQHLPDSQVYDCQIDDSGIEILLDNHKFNISDD
jgi:fucokinase